MANQSPTYYDPYIGASSGNILDNYDSSTYQIKLYMINKGAQSILPNGNSQAARQNSGALVSSLTAPPDQTIIIADTGSTAGNQIDNVTMTTYGASQSAHTTNIHFDIFQPGKANLLDQIQVAKQKLGLAEAQPHLFMEINFLGRISDPMNDEEMEGDIGLIRGPYRYELQIGNITANITEQGARFSFETTSTDRIASSDVYNRLPRDIKLTGATVSEMIKSLEAQLNNIHKGNYLYDDIFEISLLGVIGVAGAQTSPNAPPRLSASDEELYLPDQEGGEGSGTTTSNIPQTDDPSLTALELYQQTAYSKLTTEKTDQGVETNYLFVKQGTSLNDVMLFILSMCPRFQDMTTRKTNGLNSDDSLTDKEKEQAFIVWCSTGAVVQTEQWDNTYNRWSKKIRVVPRLYYTARVDMVVDPDENQNLTAAQITSRRNQMLDKGSLRKSYQYIFTGANDQIKKLDLTLDQAQSLLLAPREGKTGTLQSAVGGTLTGKSVTNNNTKEAEDQKVAELPEKNQEDKALDLFGFLKEAESSISSISGAAQQGIDLLSRTTNADPAVISELIKNGSEQEQRQFIQAQSQQSINSLVRGVEVDTQPTQSPGQTQAVGNFRFSEDFLGLSPGSALDISELSDKNIATMNLADLQNTWKQAAIKTSYADNQVEGGTQIADSNAGSLFGQLVTQSQQTHFLKRLEMTVRGDPWYLGTSLDNSSVGSDISINPEVFAQSTSEAGDFSGNDNCIVLKIASPSPRDLFSDEDQNSGYPEETLTESQFTGAYRLERVEHMFSGGEYTIDISANYVLTLAGLPEEPVNVVP